MPDLEEAIATVKSVERYLRLQGDTWYADHLSDAEEAMEKALEVLKGSAKNETE